jgi:hypothetical protein
MILKNLHWSLYFLLVVTVIVAAGAGLGAVTFPLAGLIFDTGLTGTELARNGIKNLGFYFFIWAPGIAGVLCVMRAFRRRHPDAK